MLTQTESITYKDHRITLNANLATGEFVAVATARGVTMTGRDLSAIKAVDGIKKKIDEVETRLTEKMKRYLNCDLSAAG